MTGMIDTLSAALAEQAREIERLLRGIHNIQEYLDATPPRIGDAQFDCEALLLGSKYEHGVRYTYEQACLIGMIDMVEKKLAKIRKLLEPR